MTQHISDNDYGRSPALLKPLSSVIEKIPCFACWMNDERPFSPPGHQLCTPALASLRRGPSKYNESTLCLIRPSCFVLSDSPCCSMPQSLETDTYPTRCGASWVFQAGSRTLAKRAGEILCVHAPVVNALNQEALWQRAKRPASAHSWKRKPRNVGIRQCFRANQLAFRTRLQAPDWTIWRRGGTAAHEKIEFPWHSSGSDYSAESNSAESSGV
jgi:hypothetical protein